MKLSRQRILTTLLVCVIGVAIIVMGSFYFQYISQRIYEDGTNHLLEIYSQVNNSFTSFLKENWGNLTDWNSYIQETDEDSVDKYIDERKDYWKFSEFFFIAQDGHYITPGGEEGVLDLGDALERLNEQKEYVMADDVRPNGQAFTLFAIPVEPETYRGFEYTAVALSYTNADILQSLVVDAFSGESKCFIIETS